MEEEGGKKGKKEGSNEGQANRWGKNIPQLDMVRAVSAKTGEKPRQKRTSSDLALYLQATYTCNFLPNCFKASIITKIKRTPPSSIANGYHYQEHCCLVAHVLSDSL